MYAKEYFKLIFSTSNRIADLALIDETNDDDAESNDDEVEPLNQEKRLFGFGIGGMFVNLVGCENSIFNIFTHIRSICEKKKY